MLLFRKGKRIRIHRDDNQKKNHKLTNDKNAKNGHVFLERWAHLWKMGSGLR